MKIQLSLARALVVLVVLFIVTQSNVISKNVYGVYYDLKDLTKLCLIVDNTYELSTTQYSEYLEIKKSMVVSFGKVRYMDDTIYLESENGDVFSLVASDEKKLVVGQCSGVFESHKKFFVNIGSDDNGNVEYNGFWKGGKQHGAWTYYDKNGEIRHTLYYRRGKEISREDMSNLSTKNIKTFARVLLSPLHLAWN